MKDYDTCTYGMQSEDYKRLTCPMFNCPNGNKPLVIYHEDFDKQRIDTWKWDFDAMTYGYNCKVKIHAAPYLNGKLNVELVSTGS